MGRRTLTRWQVATRFGILLGAALLVLSVVVRHVRAAGFVEEDYVSAALLVAGAVLTVGGLVINYEMVAAVFTGRRTAEGVNFAAVVLLTLGLAALFCYITTRRFARIDWTQVDQATGLRKHELHSQTRNILRALDVEVRAHVLYRPTDDPRYDVTTRVWLKQTTEMLEEFGALSPRFTHRAMDWSRPENQDDMDLLRLKMDGAPQFLNGVVFATADAHQEVAYEKTIQQSPAGGPAAFSGEDAFASALVKLTEDARTVVYALTGHGERALEAKRPPAPAGYGPASPPSTMSEDPRFSLSRLVRDLGQDNHEVRPLDLIAEGSVPADCAVLLIAGPKTPLTEEEISAIGAYLDDRMGNVIVLVDSEIVPGVETNIEELLARYGVRARTDAIGIGVEQDPFGRPVPTTRVAVLPDGMADHPATRDLAGYRLFFEQACPLEVADPRPRPMLEARALLTGLKSSWGETEMPVDKTKSVEYDPGRDVAQPAVVGVVVQPVIPQQQPGMPPPPGMVPQGPKLLVIGSSRSFIDGVAIEYPANLILFRNAVNWMAGKTHMLGIPPKRLEMSIARASQSQVMAGRYIFIGGLPACFVALGLVVWLVRRR